MAILDFTGFEAGDLAEGAQSGLTLVGPDAGAARHGLYCAALAGETAWARLAVGAAEDHRLGFALRLGALPAGRRDLACALGAGTLRLDLTAPGQLVVVDTGADAGNSGAFLLGAGSWHYLEMRVHLPPSGPRSVEVFVDGTSRVTATLAGMAGPLTGLFVGRFGGLEGELDARIDDLYSEGAPAAGARGSVGVPRGLSVSGLLAGGGFTGGSGDVDDWPGLADGDATCVVGSGTGQFTKASAIGALPAGEALLAVKAAGLIRSAAGVVSAGVGLVKGGQENYAVAGVPTSYTPAATVLVAAFADAGAPWTEALIDGYHLLLRSTGAARCTALAAFLMHSGSGPPPDPGGGGGEGPGTGGPGPGVPVLRLRAEVRRDVRLRSEVQ